MYVLACGDGSLYTGYATDVQARLAAHQSGRGAKYTKSHAPVSLVAYARFYSKARAMSAEAHFKQLSREQKDKLLERSKHEPLEDVLRRELPGFGEDTAAEFVCRSLANHVDPNYAAFMRPLVPTVDPRRLVGVRTPQLRKTARELYRRADASDFIRSLPHALFEENQVHALVIGMEREYERAIELYDLFLPYVDNWATCDQLPVRVLAEQPARTLECVRRWMSSGHGFTVRFGIGALMRLFLDDLFEPRFAAMVADVYKRQAICRLSRRDRRQCGLPHEGVVVLRQVRFCRPYGGPSVSYTHLDVYKRQVFYPRKAGTARQNRNRVRKSSTMRASGRMLRVSSSALL